MDAHAHRARSGHLLLVMFLLLVLVPGWRGAVAGQFATPPTGGCRAATEPNDQPPDATVLPEGASCATASGAGPAQDLYKWTVTDVESSTRWTIGVSAVPEQVIRLEVYTVELDDSGQVVTATKLVSAIGQADQAITLDSLLWAPATYYIAVATSGPGDYTLTVEPGAPLPAVGDPGGEAIGTFSRAATSDGAVSWTLDDADAATRWTLRLQGTVFERITLQLADANGATLLTTQVGDDGVAVVPDVGLEAGVYSLSVTGSGTDLTPWLLSAAPGGSRSAGQEDEPNDMATLGMPLTLDGDAAVVAGRLAIQGRADQSDHDYYQLAIDAEHTGRFIDLRLLWQGDVARDLCLLDGAGNELKCTTGSGGVSLQDLVLAEGEYIVAITGLPVPDIPYLLRVEATGEAVSGFEAEPNDVLAQASPLAPDGEGFAGSGRLGDTDADHFRFTVHGEPQLWRIGIEAPDTVALDLLDSTGSSMMRGAPVDGGLAIVDAYLVPGDHVVEVSGSGADYRLNMTPLGPPDPEHEREPNDTVDHSQPLRLMEQRTGRLPASLDRDVYRFSLQADTFLQVDLGVPGDGLFTMDIDRQETEVASLRSVEPGGGITFAGLLEPGDYTIWLGATTPSQETYTIVLTPQDPFVTPVDLEPNGDPALARPMPDSLRVDGVGNPADGHGADVDWYAIPPLDTGAEMAIHYTPEMTVELFTPGEAGAPPAAQSLVPGADMGEGTVSLPGGTDMLLRVTGAGPYEVALWPSSEQPPAVTPAPAASPVSLSLDLGDTPVAAYWSTGQRIDGELTIENAGEASQEVQLDARTGNAQWTVAFEQDSTVVEPGQTVVVPVTVHVAPDARADEPVFVAVRATLPGAAASAMASLTPDRVSVPAQPGPWWPLPDGLLGGLDVAWSGLGAVPVALDEASMEAEAPLYDGMTTLGTGWRWDTVTLPVDLTVDLAGDESVPVAGFTIFPAGMEPGVGSQVQNYELALSMDGQAFTVVARGSLAPVATEQAIVLDAPVEARFARLRVLSAVSPSASTVTLGEWSVIAAPGWSPGGTLNLADPALGGHIVDVQPPFPNPRDGDLLLTAGETPQVIDAAPGSALSWIVGFQHDRAAQLAALTWLDSPDSDPAHQMSRVQVEVSTGSPVGPWTPLGEWDLARDGTGRVTLELDEPVWARFIRFSGVVPTGDGETAQVELPDLVEVQERAAGPDYRSALGVWGGDRRDGPLELLEPTVLPAPDDDAGNEPGDATMLPLDETRTDVAANGVDEDWYRIEVPTGMSQLDLTITGFPGIGVTAELFDPDQQSIPVETTLTAANELHVTATVDEGATCLLRVTQPPTSVVIAFDTSFSIGTLEPTVYQGLNRFATDVQPDREFVQVVPFGEDPLLAAWSDDPWEIQGAIAAYPRTALSSDAEGAILKSVDAFEGRTGTRAIILITDGESAPSQEQMSRLWPSLAATGPRIFAVGIAGSNDAARGQDVMQDWATVGDGHDVYVRDQGAMDVAFDRAATELRRPSLYSVVATASRALPTPTPVPTPPPVPTPTPAPTAVPEPGTLAVLVPARVEGAPVTVSTQGQVAIILDTSGSMLQPLEDGTRADVARSALIDLVTTTIPPGTIVSLRTFGDTPDSCETLLAVPAGPLDPGTMSQTITDLPVINLVRTSIGASLEATLGDMSAGEGPRIVVLVTDGEETCDGDPAAAIQALVDSGIDVRVNIVGFAIDDAALEGTFEQWAELGNGRYIDAGNASELNQAVAEAVLPTFEVVDANGVVVAGGQVGGEPVSLPPGSYTVVVHTASETQLAVEVAPGEDATLTLPSAP